MTLRTLRRAGGVALLGVLSLPTLAWAQRATLSGRITDARGGETLPGANVLVLNARSASPVGGAAANGDGVYRVTLPAGTYAITFRYVGYAERQTTITLADGETRTLDMALSEEGINLNETIVTASRQEEQVLNAPASVSVLGAQEIRAAVTPSSVGVLRNTTGVDIAQTGVDRQEVVLRGFNNAFSGATYTLVDYRQAAVPSLNVNIYSIMPNQPTDLERVEVVRGPGSALYGPGVDAGVVHFLTRDPFTSRGTTVALSGGERALFSGEARHAGVVGNKLGYKIAGAFTRADDWELRRRGNLLDSVQLVQDKIFGPNDTKSDAQTVDASGRLQRNYDYQKYLINGLLQYRVSPATTVSVNAGTSSLTGVVLSGIGTLQADRFGYSYGQVRVQSGGLFVQGYANFNDAGDSYVYGTGQTVVDKGIQYVAQTQYDFEPLRKVRVISGLDARFTLPDTEGTILGRNEDRDQVNQYGAYAQASTPLMDALTLTAALRGDYNNVVDDFQLSPRAALVFAVNGTNTVRATYNRAFSAPGTNSLFLDIAARELIPGQTLKAILYGRGNADGFTFANFRANPQARFLLPVPGVFGRDFSTTAFPAQPVYGFGRNVIQSQIAGNTAPADILALNPAQRTAFLNLMGSLALGAGTSTVPTILGNPLATSRECLTQSIFGYCPKEAPVDAAPLKQTTTQTAELGYKGLFGGRFLVEIDGYYSEKKNFIGPLLIETPLAYLDYDGVVRNVNALAAGNAQVQGALAAYSAACNADPQSCRLTQGAALNLISIIFARVPGGIVQSDQAVLPSVDPNRVGGFLSYRNFGRVRYYGADINMQFAPTGRTNLFANASLVSDDFFDNKELDEANVALEVALNAPRFKTKFGGSYSIPQSWSANVSGRYQDGFPVRSGPYTGQLESFFLLDLGAGYDFSRVANGLRLDVLVQNVLNDKRREFIGAPEIGRMALARMTFSF